MKIIPLQTPGQTPSTNDPRPLEGLKYVLELNGAQLFAFRAVARNISGAAESTVRRYTDELSTEDNIPGLPSPFESDASRRWYTGALGAKALSALGAPEPASPEAEPALEFHAGDWVTVVGDSVTDGASNRIGGTYQLDAVDRVHTSIPYKIGRDWYKDSAVAAPVWWNPQQVPEPGAGFRFLTESEWIALSSAGCQNRGVETVREYWSTGGEDWATRFTFGCRLTTADTYRVPVGWQLKDSEPKVSPAPSPLAPGFNPSGLSVIEVDPEGEGWRLLSQAEVTACTKSGDPYTDPEGFDFPGFPDTQYLSTTDPAGWSETDNWFAYDAEEGAHGTLRTQRPEGYYLVRRSGVHNPAKLKPEQVGDRYRLLTVDEAASPAKCHQGSQYRTCADEWSNVGDWRAYNSKTGTLRVRK